MAKDSGLVWTLRIVSYKWESIGQILRIAVCSGLKICLFHEP